MPPGSNLYRDARMRANAWCEKEWRPMNMHSFAQSPYLNHEWDEAYPEQGRNEASAGATAAKRISTVPETVRMQSWRKFMATVEAMAAGENCLTGAARGKSGLRHAGR